MNTRFRPTPYLDLHLGHVYVARMDYGIAQASGGKFYLVLDDFTYHLKLASGGFSLAECERRYLEDLEWLGLPTDPVAWWCTNGHKHLDKAAYCDKCGEPLEPEKAFLTTTNAASQAEAAEVLGLRRGLGLGNRVFRPDSAAFDAYNAWQVMTCVVDDHDLGVGGFTRGAELVGQRELYAHFWDRLYGTPGPAQMYVPVLFREGVGKESKSGGSPTVRQLREAGYEPDDIHETLIEMATRAERNLPGPIRFASDAANVIDLVFPADLLTPNEIKTLEYNRFWQRDNGKNSSQYEEPWYADARKYIRTCQERMEVARANRRARQAARS